MKIYINKNNNRLHAFASPMKRYYARLAGVISHGDEGMDENEDGYFVIQNIAYDKYVYNWLSNEVFERNYEEVKTKPFDLESAKAGKPVCTRFGQKVEIKKYYDGGGIFGHAWRESDGGAYVTIVCSNEGKSCGEGFSEYDLFMKDE